AHEVSARAGELQIPAEFAAAMPEKSGWPRLVFDTQANELRAAPAMGYAGPVQVTTRGGVTELRIPTGHPEAAAVVVRGRPRFRLRVAGALLGSLPDSLPDDGLLRDLRVTAVGAGLHFELAIDPAAGGWRLERSAQGGVNLI